MQLRSNDRFIRWQTILREQLTFLNNALLALAIAILGGLVALLHDNDFAPKGCEKLFFTAGLLLCLASVIVGFLVALNRLNDFRKTVNKIKSELNTSNFDELKENKELTALLGKITWRLFDAQVYLLLAGVVGLLAAFAMIYNEKLF
jgi:hypothetical protein